MNARQKSSDKDPIEVYCRIRPLANSAELACLRAKDKHMVVLFLPESLQNSRTVKEVHCTFKEVFDVDTTQEQLFKQIALPLVEDVLHGRNGLIFTYGITSSGKTYTMSGSRQDGGLLPRSLDVIFNSIKDCQAAKCVFKSDQFNAFDVQSALEAKRDLEREPRNYNRTLMKTPREKTVIGRSLDNTVLETPADVHFAIFVSYVEIYNNYIYDLLEDSNDPKKRLTFNSKILRKDEMGDMYVFGATENEVRTADEALDLFFKGQLRRKVSHTALNTESSRSHSVFTIRIVQAPLGVEGADIIMDKRLIILSQLSLVDLAGSERCVRTKNTGYKLREAGNINASLMTLRNCIELLRESQSHNVNRKIPYRESKLTHLFKRYFEGQGKIKMVVCVNPQAEYYDETVHVMKFAEVTQDVLIARSVSTPFQVGLTPGRGKFFREAAKRAKEEGVPVSSFLPSAVYTLGPEFPELTNDFSNDEGYASFIDFLENRKNRRILLEQDLLQKQEEFRANLMAVDAENAKLKQEKSVLKMDLENRNQQLQNVEDRLISFEHIIQTLEKQNTDLQAALDTTKIQLQNANRLLSEERRQAENIKIRMQDKIASEKERMKRIMEKRLAEKQAELERKMCFTDERFRQLREILNADDWDFYGDVAWSTPTTLSSNPYLIQTSSTNTVCPPVSSTSNNFASQSTLPPSRVPKSMSNLNVTSVETRYVKTRSASASIESRRNKESTVRDTARMFEKENRAPFTSEKSIVVSNPRHRRSRSNTKDKWIEHKPIGNLDLGTVLQPIMKNKKSVSEVRLKDFEKADAYVLEHQKQDSQGEFETHLYKGDVLPSLGGGAQVIFNDVETLRQGSPPYNFRKRSSDELTLSEMENGDEISGVKQVVPSKILKIG